MQKSIGVIGPGTIGKIILNSCGPQTSYYHHKGPQKDLPGVYSPLPDLLRKDIVFLSVKPQSFLALAQSIRESSSTPSGSLYVSIMAGVSLATLQRELRSQKVMRMMFNLGGNDIFVTNNLGENLELSKEFKGLHYYPEEKMDAITALYGCGTGFITRFIQLYHSLAQEYGLEDISHTLNLVRGTLDALEVVESPQVLIDMVACKGGATEKAISKLDGIQPSLEECIRVAYDRCREISQDTSTS